MGNSNVEIETGNADWGQMIVNAVTVDPELRPDCVKREIKVEKDIIKAYVDFDFILSYYTY